MATTKSINELLLSFMQDIYYAERQILKELPNMSKAAQSEAAASALITAKKPRHVVPLQKAFDMLPSRAGQIARRYGPQ